MIRTRCKKKNKKKSRQSLIGINERKDQRMGSRIRVKGWWYYNDRLSHAPQLYLQKSFSEKEKEMKNDRINGNVDK